MVVKTSKCGSLESSGSGGHRRETSHQMQNATKLPQALNITVADVCFSPPLRFTRTDNSTLATGCRKGDNIGMIRFLCPNKLIQDNDPLSTVVRRTAINRGMAARRRHQKR